MAYIGAAFMPLFICVTIGIALFKRLDVFSLFVEGAKQGFDIVFSIAPSILGLLVAVGMLSSSGALDRLTALLAPLAAKLGFPGEVLPLVLLRPVSGSGAIALLEDILTKCGPDSPAGKLACVICGSSETTFYTIALYFGSVKIRKTRYAVPAAAVADLTVAVTAAVLLRIIG